MRVLQINNQHFCKGGAHKVYFNTAELLKEKGHEVLFFSMKDEFMIPYEYSYYFPEAFDYRNPSWFSRVKSIKKFLYNNEACYKLKEFIKFKKPDIAHLHLFMGGLSNGILKTLKEFHIPVVHTIHDFRLICPAYSLLDNENKPCEKCIDRWYVRCAVNRCSYERKYSHSVALSIDSYYRKHILDPLKYIDMLIFVSRFSRDMHIHFNPAFNDNSCFIYNFNSFTTAGSPVKGDYFLYFGRLSREKGIESLIHVAKKLKIRLKIAGTGPLEKELSEKSDKNIEILGYKYGSELYSLIQNSSFVIVPSICYENNPLAIVESFSLGKPVIGSSVGGIPELLQDNRGILFEPQNEESLTEAIIEAASLRQQEYVDISQNCLEFALQEFSSEKHYESLIKVYRTAITINKIINS
jgi:glycosyltransferase involved in cell wall biosynthesis